MSRSDSEIEAKYIFWTHLTTFIYNIAMCALNFDALNGFLRRLANADHKPEFISGKNSTIDHDFTDFVFSYQIYMVILFNIGIATLFITIQNSVPQRLEALFAGEKVTTKYRLPKKYELPLALSSGLVKTTAGMCALLNLSCDFVFPGFYAGLAITLLLEAPGDILAQIDNLSPSEKNIFNLTNPYLIYFYSVCCTIGYTGGSVALYADSIDYSLYKIGWTSTPLHKTPISDYKFWLFNGLHLIFLAAFMYQTVKNYFPRFVRMLSKPKADDALLLLMNPVERYAYRLFNRLSSLSVMTASYKTVSTFFSLLSVSNIFLKLGKLSDIKIIYICLLGLSQICNLVTQLIFYSKLNADLKEENAHPKKTGILGEYNKVCALFSACKNKCIKSERNPELLVTNTLA